LGTASTASAQIEVAGFAGTMVPIRVMIIDTAGSTYFNMSAHRVYGIRIGKPLSPTLGLEFQLGTGSGSFDALSGGTTIINLPSNVYFADARLRLRLLGSSDASLNAIGGVGYTKFSTGLFQVAHEADSGTNLKGVVTGIIGLGVRAKVNGQMTLSVDATDRIHSQMVEVSGGLSGLIEQMQHDATVLAGVSFTP
jgi:hypothetical protein